jgi:hypothetical protein
MNRFVATLVPAFIMLTVSAASATAQVNCNVAPNPASRANCQRALIGIYQEQARNHAAIERELAARARSVEQAQNIAGYMAGRHKDPRVGAAWDGGKLVGEAASEFAFRSPRVRNWNNRLYGQ